MIALGTAAMLVACKPADVMPNTPVDMASVARGRDAAQRLGCGACHAMPGVWPASDVGPRLHHFAARALIAGRLPNRPDVLARFVRNAPAYVPGTGMPAIPMTDAQADDIAAYLHGASGE